MPSPPFAAVQASIAGGGNVSGGIVATTGQTVQLSAASTVGWANQLWEIYEWPLGFAVPAGWTLVGNSLQSTAVTPPIFTLSPWGKYLVRLTVNGGLLNGVYQGPGSVQPLVDIATGISTPSPSGLIDIGFGETNQFDAVRQWDAALKANLRALDAYGILPAATTTSSTTANQTIATIPIAASSGVTKIDLVVAAHRTGAIAEGYTAAFATSYYDIGAGPVIIGADTISDPKTVGAASASLSSAVSGQNILIRATPWNAGSTKWVVATQAIGPAT